MICPKCGENIVEGSNGCPKCGSHTNDAPQFVENSPKTISDSTPIMNTQPEPVIISQIPITNNIVASDEPQIISTQPPVVDNPIATESMQNTTIPQPEINSNNPTKKKRNKTLLIIIIVILMFLVGIIVLLVKRYSGISPKGKTDSIFQADSLIKIQKDGKYGFIDSKGKEKIKPQYDTATNFYNEYAIVSFRTKENSTEKKQYAVIDKSGNVKITADYETEIEYNAFHNFWIIKDQLYDSSLKKVSPDNLKIDYVEEGYFIWHDDNKKTGIMNASGKTTYTYTLKENEKFFFLDVPSVDSVFKERYCIPTIDAEKYAVVNCDTGKIIYDYTKAMIVGDNNNIFHISDLKTYNHQKQFYVQNDEIVYQTTDSSISLSYYNGNIKIRNDNKPYDQMYSYIDVSTGKKTDKENKIEIDEEWEKLMDVKEFSCDTGVGLMKGSKVVIPCEWSNFEQLDLSLSTILNSKGKQYIIAEKDDKSYLLNIKSGKSEAEFNATNIYDYTGSTFIRYTDNDTKKMVIYNLMTGKSLSVEDDIDFSAYANYITLKENNKLKYYNMNMELIYTEE